MVRYASQTFTFNGKNKEAYFQLINKYYSGIGADIILNSEDDCVIVKGIKLDYQILSELPNAGIYKIKTEEFQRNCVVFNMIPKFNIQVLNKYSINKYTVEHINIAKMINTKIKNRIDAGIHNIKFLSTKFPLGTFADILASLRLLEVIEPLNTKNITKYYISHKSKLVLFILNDKYGLIIRPSGIIAGNLPSFDIDEGFIDDEIYPQEWDKDFAKWKKEFDETNGANWDDPIIETSHLQFKPVDYDTKHGFPPNSVTF